MIPNDRLLQVVDKKASIQQAFLTADDVLRQGIQGISELITIPGLINLDFADVRAVMNEGGSALMSIGTGQRRQPGTERCRAGDPQRAPRREHRGRPGHPVQRHRRHGPGLHEVNAAAEIIQRTADPDANIIFGAVIDPNMKDAIRITVIATGFDAIKDQKVTQGEESRVVEFPRRTYDREDLDIPAFLRRANRNQ